MKATGIVRKIDDLGRIVIPKEIRRTMKIREGDPLYNLLLHTLKLTLALSSFATSHFISKKIDIFFFLWYYF